MSECTFGLALCAALIVALAAIFVPTYLVIQETKRTWDGAQIVRACGRVVVYRLRDGSFKTGGGDRVENPMTLC